MKNKDLNRNNREKGRKFRLPAVWPPFAFLTAFAFMSSCNYLNVDNYFDDEFKLDSTFTKTRYVEAYMWGMVNMFPDEAATLRLNHTPGPYATDEGFINVRAGNIVYNGTNFCMGFITPDDLKELNVWDDYYKIIRKCNTILTRMNEAKDMTIQDSRNIEGYTRFFRAYAYYNLLVDFGPPILLGDEIVENNEPMEYYDRARSTYDETVEYICSELQMASRYMPTSVALMNFGRPTKGAALALVARLRLIHASPAFNGSNVARRYFSSWTRKTDGIPYITQNADGTGQRWAVAAAAAKQVIDLTLDGRPMYALYTVEADNKTPALPVNTSDPNYHQTYPDGAGGIDPYRSYSELFNGECSAPTVQEFIWAKRSAYVKSYYLTGPFPISLGGWGRFGVTQKMVDAYLMNDGRTKEEALSDGYYSETGYLDVPKTFSGYTLNAGVYNMYVNREARFYASIGFNEAVWECLSTTDETARMQSAQYYATAVDGKGTANEPLNYSITGYVIKKWVHPQDALKGTVARKMDKVYAIFRYAEILLSYAEALNNIDGNYTVDVGGQLQTFTRNTEEIRKAFNLVRYRAGLPGLTDPDLDDPKRIQELIERERMVEFTHENRRYYDVRRWGIYEETEREPVTGMNTDAQDKASFYQRMMLGSGSIRGRVVDKKLMFVPIPRTETRRLPSLDQNPGWN
jgi:hypothetical protein